MRPLPGAKCRPLTYQLRGQLVIDTNGLLFLGVEIVKKVPRVRGVDGLHVLNAVAPFLRLPACSRPTAIHAVSGVLVNPAMPVGCACSGMVYMGSPRAALPVALWP